MSALARIGARGLDMLERVTGPARRRNAEAIVYAGREHPVWGPISGLYFSLAAGVWDASAQGADHVAGFAEGLEHVRTPSAVLDLGTGAGGSAALVATRFPDASVVAIDSSRRMLAYATERHSFPNLVFRRAPITVLPAADASIDLVVMLNAVPSIREVARVATADAQVLGASTYVGANAEGSKWMETWRVAGFTRVATGASGAGHWDLLQRA